jgi:ribonuclease P protein component
VRVKARVFLCQVRR